MVNILKWAMYYKHKKYYSVIPLKPDKEIPAIEDWERYQHVCAGDVLLEKWFGNTNNNIGIMTGVISDEVGVVILTCPQQIEFANNNFPITPVVETPSGFHYYYHVYGSRERLRPSALPYVVAPPSICSGQSYQWVEGKHIIKIPTASVSEIDLTLPAKTSIEQTIQRIFAEAPVIIKNWVIPSDVFEDDIWKKPPDYLKVWIYLLGKVNKNMQYLCGYEELQEQLMYKKGFQEKKRGYEYIKAVLKYLRSTSRIITKRQGKGTIITIIKD